jgi:hypothetical protein
MTKTVLIAASLAFAGVALPVSASNGGKSAVGPSAQGSREVRYTAGPSNRKASKPKKVVITRDSSGRVISVRRG